MLKLPYRFSKYQPIISFGYFSVKIVVKRSVLLHKSLSKGKSSCAKKWVNFVSLVTLDTVQLAVPQRMYPGKLL